MENQTFNYKDDRFSIRPQAPPGGQSHFSISDSGYGDKDIYHPHKRNNHPNNDINPPPNHVKKENVIESTSNGAAPVTGNRPSIKLRAPPGGKSSLDYYSSEDNYKPSPAPGASLTKNETIYDEPEKKECISENNTKTEPQTEQNGRKGSHSNTSSSFFNSNDSQSNYRPVYTPQAPPGGKDSISLGASTIEKPKQNNRYNYNKSTINYEEENKPYKPYYAPQAPPGGKDSISLGISTIEKPKQNNKYNYNKSTINYEEENKPYKPYYAPQAPPGGKDSISLGYDEPDTKPKPKPKPNPEFQESPVKNQPTTTTTPGRRMNAQNNQLNSSIFNSKDDNKPYKPYYAPQAPPGGKDSISFGNAEPADTNMSFSGRRRNYKNDHFKSSFSFNY